MPAPPIPTDPATTDLTLGGCGLTELPRGVTDLIALEELDLSGNLLTTLPPEIGRLANLRILYLQDNQLTALPPEIGDLVNLRTLQLDRNRLTALPPELSRLPYMRSPQFPKNTKAIVTPRRSLTFSENPLIDPPPNIRGVDEMMLYLREKLIASAPLAIKTTAAQYMAIVRALIDDGGTQLELREGASGGIVTVIQTRNTRVSAYYDGPPPSNLAVVPVGTTTFRAGREEVLDYLTAFVSRNRDRLDL